MKNKYKIFISFFLIFIIITLIWLWYFFLYKKESVVIEIKTEEELEIEELSKEIQKVEIKKDEVEKKMDLIKKKMTLKWIISNADMYYENYMYNVALVKYLQVYRDIPDDSEINIKIWDLYYKLKKFDKSYKYYNKVKNDAKLDVDKYIYSTVNKNLTKSGWINTIKNDISTLNIDNQKSFYYKNGLECIEDLSICRENYSVFFKEKESSWSLLISELQNINDSFVNYKNFQMDDLLYEDAITIWAFYKNGFYALSLELSKKVLETYPDYKPIIEIAAKSYYELWDYISAKNYLLKYKKIDSEDAENSYFLARVYEKLGENILSIIQYDNALKKWYKDKTDVLRRLVFIYYDMWEQEKMLERFKNLIENGGESININDYNLAIYYQILNQDFELAKSYSNKAIQKFPDSEIFYWYSAWIIMQKEDISDIEFDITLENINKATEINQKNPMITLVKWIYEYKKWNFDSAFLYFKRTISQDKSGEYKDIANLWLDKIKNNK